MRSRKASASTRAPRLSAVRGQAGRRGSRSSAASTAAPARHLACGPASAAGQVIADRAHIRPYYLAVVPRRCGRGDDHRGVAVEQAAHARTVTSQAFLPAFAGPAPCQRVSRSCQTLTASFAVGGHMRSSRAACWRPCVPRECHCPFGLAPLCRQPLPRTRRAHAARHRPRPRLGRLRRRRQVFVRESPSRTHSYLHGRSPARARRGGPRGGQRVQRFAPSSRIMRIASVRGSPYARIPRARRSAEITRHIDRHSSRLRQMGAAPSPANAALSSMLRLCEPRRAAHMPRVDSIGHVLVAGPHMPASGSRQNRRPWPTAA